MVLNNIGAMRSAIVYCIPRITIMRDDALGDSGHFLVGDEVYESCCNMLRELQSALDSAPPRNCDVGTAEEQANRFELFCHLGKEHDCGDCRLWDSGAVGHNCELRWGQLPYDAAQEGCDHGEKQVRST